MDLAAADQGITSWFYFTGGTALSEFYLHHRLSEDLDFFSNTEFSHEIVDQFIQKASKRINAKPQKKNILGHAIINLHLKDKSTLKIDFVHQPYKSLETGGKYKDLRLASIWDIAVDKLYTIFNRVKARDFVDLYFLMKETDCSLEQLISAMQEKYEIDFDEISLLSRLPIVKDLSDFPTMLVPFDKKEMEKFYLNLTKKMENKLFK